VTAVLYAALIEIIALSVISLSLPSGHAANPTAGTISPAGPDVTWQGPLSGGACANETSCVEGANCDTFKLTLSGTEEDWAGKVVNITINWTNPANDYDLYIHKGENCPTTGPCQGPIVSQDGNGAPSTREAGSIDPSSTGTGVYLVRLVIFSVTPGDPFTGTASVGPEPPGRKASYVKDGMTFSPNVTVKAPVARRDGEPSSRTDKFGNHYTSAIRGVPAGVDLWYFDLRPGSPTYDPKMRNPIYRGQPDSFTQDTATSLGADGGGDVDLAVGFDSNDPAAPPVLAYSSLVAANVATGKSLNRGETFQLNPAGNATGGVPTDDRQWLEFYGKNTVYMLYRTIAPTIAQVQRSDDGGFTYGPSTVVGAIGQVGYIDVHQASGTVYVSGSTGQVCVGRPASPTVTPTSYTCKQVAESNEKGDYSFGLSDRGDHFFVRAQTPATVTTAPFVSPNQFTFGTVTRLSDGSLAYTTRGDANSGSFDSVNKTITVKVAASKLNPFVTKGPAIGAGSVLTGLKGQTFTIGANAKTDITRGGTLFTIDRCQIGNGGGGGGGGGGNSKAFRVTGTGKILGKVVSFEINVDDLPSGRLKYNDKEQNIDLISDKITGFNRLADNKVAFTGEGTVNGNKVTFTVEVEDNGESGTNDRFKIIITGFVNSMREGALTQGNIQFHQ